MSKFETVFSTKWFSIEASDTNGQVDPVYRIRQQDSVIILPITPNGEFVLIQQFRPVLDKWCTEFPAGGIEPNESPEDAARRELLEETGYEAERWDMVLGGVIRLERETNQNYFFLARDAKPLSNLEFNPEFSVKTVTASSLRASILDGSFDHIIGLSALMSAQVKLGSEEFGFQSYLQQE